MSKPRPDTSISKRCSGCKQEKPPTEFFKSKSTFDQLLAYCKECSKARNRAWHKDKKNRPYLNEKLRQWRIDNLRRSKDYRLRKNYGIPLGTFDELFAKQNGKCAICETDSPNGMGDFHVDHCHETGEVRGLLCHSCNVGIGQFQHDPTLLRLAMAYLMRR